MPSLEGVRQGLKVGFRGLRTVRLGHRAVVERPVEDVREDVRQGYVSVKAAAERYGVVVDAETFAVDQAATDRLRARN